MVHKGLIKHSVASFVAIQNEDITISSTLPHICLFWGVRGERQRHTEKDSDKHTERI